MSFKNLYHSLEATPKTSSLTQNHNTLKEEEEEEHLQENTPQTKILFIYKNTPGPFKISSKCPYECHSKTCITQ